MPRHIKRIALTVITLLLVSHYSALTIGAEVWPTDAVFKISVSTRKLKNVAFHVPVPERLRAEAKGVKIVSSNQETEVSLEATPVFHKGVVIGADVFSTKSHARRLPPQLDLYFLSEASPSSASSSGEASSRRSVLTWNQSRKMITRPHTPAEVEAFFHRNELVLASGYGQALPGIFTTKRNLNNPEHFKKFKTLTFRYSTQFRLAQPREIRLGSRLTEHSVWFFYVNGKCVSSWQDAGDEDSIMQATSSARNTQQDRRRTAQWTPTNNKVVLGKTIQLPPGLHRFDVICFARHANNLPLPYWQLDSEAPVPLPPQRLHPTNINGNLRIQWPDGRETPWMLNDYQNTLIFPETNARFHHVTTQLQTEETAITTREPECHLLTPTGKLKLTVSKSSFLNTDAMPSVQLPVYQNNKIVSRITIPGRQMWRRPRYVRPKLRFKTIPVTHVTGSPLELVYEINGLPPKLLKGNLSIQIHELTAERTVLETHSFPLRSQVSTALSFIPDAKTQNLVSYLVLGNEPLLAGKRILLPTPSSNPLPEIDTWGNKLIFKDIKTPIILSGIKAWQPNAYYAEASKRLLKGGHLIIVDEYWSTKIAPQADTPLPFFLKDSDLFKRIQVLPVETGYQQHARYSLEKFPLMQTAMNKADMVVWTAGKWELQEGDSIESLKARLTFLADACLNRDILPVFCTPPASISNVKRDKLQRAALMIKRLGIQRNIPIVDIYSVTAMMASDKTKTTVAEEWFTVPDMNSPLPCLNNKGREAVCDLLKKVLRDYYAD